MEIEMIIKDKQEAELARAIAKRAAALANSYGMGGNPLTFLMDISACHMNGTPLNLQRLLLADDGNFGHDVFGINQHLDRETGKLAGCFSPRFAKRPR